MAHALFQQPREGHGQYMGVEQPAKKDKNLRKQVTASLRRRQGDAESRVNASSHSSFSIINGLVGTPQKARNDRLSRHPGRKDNKEVATTISDEDTTT